MDFEFNRIKQVAKLGPVSRAAGMDCEYPLDYKKIAVQNGYFFVLTEFPRGTPVRFPVNPNINPHFPSCQNAK